MTIALPIPGSPDEIATYDGLVSAIQYTLKDTTLATHAPRFIYLAECEFNRVLSNPENEATVITTTAETITLPNDFKSMRSMYLDTDPRVRLEYMAPDELRDTYNSQTTGKPQVYTLVGDAIEFGPAPDDDYTLVMNYNRMLSNLSDNNQTNWLVEKHADLYLYAALTHAEFYGWNDERVPLLREFVSQVYDQINGVGNRRRVGTNIRVRPSVSV